MANRFVLRAGALRRLARCYVCRRAGADFLCKFRRACRLGFQQQPKVEQGVTG